MTIRVCMAIVRYVVWVYRSYNRTHMGRMQ